MLKLNLGCGADIIPGYINVDQFSEKADQQYDISKLPHADNSVDEIFSSHVIEHFDFYAGQAVLKEWIRVLKPGGMLIIETPNFLTSCEAFCKASEKDRVDMYAHFFSEPWKEGFVHKFLYTPTELIHRLRQLGMKNIVQRPPTRYTFRGNMCMRFECQK
jgi:predicted SAM-dependent methyltransferase